MTTEPLGGAATIDALIAAGTMTLTAAGIGTPRLDAELLLATACATDRTGLYSRGQQAVTRESAAEFRTLVARRCGREPLQYIVGRQEFWSLDFVVTPNVLIPRAETERLVELAIRLLRSGVVTGRQPATLCDVGTGSGCVAIALARELPHATVCALDLSLAALGVARANAQRHGVAERVRFFESDLFAAVAGQRFDVIVCNPPYVSTAVLPQLQPELAWEPRRALDGGDDGLDVIRRVLVAAPEHLADGGWLLMEIGADQADAVLQLARPRFASAVVEGDYAGLPRVLVARRERDNP